jgi:hypothetical protein
MAEPVHENIEVLMHHTRVPQTPAELLFVDFEDTQPPSPNLAAVEIEIFECEAPEIMMASLGAAGLVIPQGRLGSVRAQLRTLEQHDEVEDQRKSILEAAIARHKMAQAMISGALREFAATYTTPRAAASDEGMTGFNLNHDAYTALKERTDRFKELAPLAVILGLKPAVSRGIIAEADRTTAERGMRVLYDQATRSNDARVA